MISWRLFLYAFYLHAHTFRYFIHRFIAELQATVILRTPYSYSHSYDCDCLYPSFGWGVYARITRSRMGCGSFCLRVLSYPLYRTQTSLKFHRSHIRGQTRLICCCVSDVCCARCNRGNFSILIGVCLGLCYVLRTRRFTGMTFRKRIVVVYSSIVRLRKVCAGSWMSREIVASLASTPSQWGMVNNVIEAKE